MGQSFELQAATEKNPEKNSELVHRVKSSRKNSRVTRSQINDFHAHTNTNEKEKEEEEEEEEEVGEKELNLQNISRTQEKKSNRYHVCKHCKRAFSSGRALGGHIRIHRASFTGGGGGGHVDLSYNSSTNSLLKPPEVDGSENSDSDSSASSHGFSNGCSPKMVSLYTLRNNPKRSSILMDPEFALDLIGASGSVSASASASTAKRSRNSYWAESNSGIVGPCSGSEIRRVLLPNWSVTKSRSSRGGGGGGVKRDGFLFPKEDAVADDRDTAQLLVMLAGRTRRNNNVDNNEGRESTEESVFDSKPLMISNLESQGSIEDLGGSEESRIVEKKRKRRKKNTHKNERAEEAGNSSVKVLESDMDMDVDVGRTAIIIEEQHQCNTCKKVFNSHQALGGHRASHRKVKGCFAAEGENQGGGEGEEEEEEEGEGEGSLMVEAAVQIEEEGAVAMSHLTQEQESFSHKMGKQPQLQPHRCTICHRVFGSGQALGGHKRCHWIGDRITETTTSAISTEQHQHESGGGGGSVRDRSTREEVLDLNQPPPIDEDYFRGASRFDACAESVNQRVKMAGGSFANSTVDSFKAD